jgi:hypothetical protein
MVNTCVPKIVPMKGIVRGKFAMDTSTAIFLPKHGFVSMFTFTDRFVSVGSKTFELPFLYPRGVIRIYRRIGGAFLGGFA